MMCFFDQKYLSRGETAELYATRSSHTSWPYVVITILPKKQNHSRFRSKPKSEQEEDNNRKIEDDDPHFPKPKLTGRKLS